MGLASTFEDIQERLIDSLSSELSKEFSVAKPKSLTEAKLRGRITRIFAQMFRKYDAQNDRYALILKFETERATMTRDMKFVISAIERRRQVDEESAERIQGVVDNFTKRISNAESDFAKRIRELSAQLKKQEQKVRFLKSQLAKQSVKKKGSDATKRSKKRRRRRAERPEYLADSRDIEAWRAGRARTGV